MAAQVARRWPLQRLREQGPRQAAIAHTPRVFPPGDVGREPGEISCREAALDAGIGPPDAAEEAEAAWSVALVGDDDFTGPFDTSTGESKAASVGGAVSPGHAVFGFDLAGEIEQLAVFAFARSAFRLPESQGGPRPDRPDVSGGIVEILDHRTGNSYPVR